MKLTNLMLVEFVLKVLAKGARYWYGTFGLKATTSLYNSKKGQYPGHYTSARAAQYKKDIAEAKWVADCVGLIKWFFWSLAGTRDTKYADGFPDVSADQFIAGYCDKTGSISTLPETPGLVLWCKGHIGVYIGSGWAIEARGFAYGVVKTKVKDRTWTKWGQIKSKYITYTDGTVDVGTGAPSGNPYPVPTRILRNGSKGQDVKWAQFELNQEGESLSLDGEFGPNTLAATKRMQKTHKLDADGEIGPLTIAVLQRCDGQCATAPKPVPETEPGPVIPVVPAPYVKPGMIIDVSHHNSADWDTAVKNHNISMAIIRVQDNTTLDRNLKTNVKGVTKHNIPYGFYAFIRCQASDDAHKEADLFVDRALAACKGQAQPRVWMVDAEDGNPAGAVKAFATRLRDRLVALGLDPLIGLYASDSDMINRYKGITAKFHRIWTADWRTACKKWSDIWCESTDLWQYGYVTVKGLGSTVDGNRLPDGVTVEQFLTK